MPKSSTISGAQTSISYQAPHKSGHHAIHSKKHSAFQQLQQRVAFFAMGMMRLKPQGSSTPTLSNDFTIDVKRAGAYLMHMVLVLDVFGIVAYQASPTTGVPNTNGWLDPHESLDIQPRFHDMAGLAAVSTIKMELGNTVVATITNDALLDLAELCGQPGRSINDFIGAYGGATTPADLAKETQTFMIPIPAFFSVSPAAALPSVSIMIHQMSVNVTLAGLSALIYKDTTLTVGEVGGGTSTDLLFSDATFQIYVRPLINRSDEYSASIPWGSKALTKVVGEDNLIRSVYLISNNVFVDEVELKITTETTRVMHLPSIITYCQSVSATNSGDVKLDITNAPFKKITEAIMIHARRGGAQFADIDANPDASRPSAKDPIVKSVDFSVDDNLVFSLGNREAKLMELWCARTMTDMNIILLSHSLALWDFNVRGSRNNKRANELLFSLILNKDAFSSSGTSSVSVYLTAIYRLQVKFEEGEITLQS